MNSKVVIEYIRDAYVIAASMVLAIVYGLAPHARRKNGKLSYTFPLFPDDLLRESPQHLGEARLYYSERRVSRMVEQGMNTISIFAGGAFVERVVERENFSSPLTELPEGNAAEKTNWILEFIWPAEQELPGMKGGPMSGSDSVSWSNIDQTTIRLALLNGADLPQLREQFRERIELGIGLVEEHWSLILGFVATLLRAENLPSSIALEMGNSILDEQVPPGPMRDLMAFHRDRTWIGETIEESTERFWNSSRPLLYLLLFTLKKRMAQLCARFLAWGPAAQKIDDHGAKDAAREGARYKASLLLLGLYNGSYIKWNAWRFEEFLPDLYCLPSLHWLKVNLRQVAFAQQKRILEQSGWALQAAIAGKMSKLALSSHEWARLIESEDDPYIAPHVAQIRLLLPDDEVSGFIAKCVAETGQILRAHAVELNALTALIEEEPEPAIEAVDDVAGHLIGERHRNNPGNALIFESSRERLAMEQLRIDMAADEYY